MTKCAFELTPDQRAEAGSAPDTSFANNVERVLVTRREAIPSLEVWTVTGSNRHWRVFHTSYAFCSARAMAARDPVRWLYRRRVHRMDLSSTRLLEAGELHVTLHAPRADFDVLLVQPDGMLDAKTGRAVHFTAGQLDDPRVARALLRLSAKFAEQTDDLEVETIWSRLASHLVECAGERGTTLAPATVCQRSVKRVREFLHQADTRNTSLTELAALVGVSKFHLERSFRSVVGLPVHKYLTSLRVGRALDYLRRGGLPADVAKATGFCDVSHLSRAFKAQLGLTPGYFASEDRRRGRIEKTTLRASGHGALSQGLVNLGK